MASEENANAPEVICAEMQSLQEKRGIIMADVKEFKDTLAYWSPSEEANIALKRMPLMDERLGAYLSKYFDELSTDALKKSPYKLRCRTLPMSRLLSDCQKDIQAGKMQIYEISGNALDNLEKNMSCLSKCTISSQESKQCEELQKGLLDYSAELLLNDACCQSILTLSTITDVSEQVSQLKKIKRKLNSWSRRKMRSDWSKQMQLEEPPLNYACTIIQNHDPEYESDNDVFDVVPAADEDTKNAGELSDDSSNPKKKGKKGRGSRGKAMAKQRSEKGQKLLRMNLASAPKRPAFAHFPHSYHRIG